MKKLRKLHFSHKKKCTEVPGSNPFLKMVAGQRQISEHQFKTTIQRFENCTLKSSYNRNQNLLKVTRNVYPLNKVESSGKEPKRRSSSSQLGSFFRCSILSHLSFTLSEGSLTFRTVQSTFFAFVDDACWPNERSFFLLLG